MIKAKYPDFDNTVDNIEIEKFSAMAEEWWDENGKFKPLHKLNPIRIAFLRDYITENFNRDPFSPAPLKGLNILDIGCGGGLISEPLARLGATVTGLDASELNIEVAQLHAKEMGLKIDYMEAPASELVRSRRQFDAVVNLEVIEHVADKGQFMTNCASLLKPNGLMVLSTLNRTAKSFALAIVGAEYLLRWLPLGTHDWRRFVRPSELAAFCRDNSLTISQIYGLQYNLISNSWNLNPDDISVNYIAVIKPSIRMTSNN